MKRLLVSCVVGVVLLSWSGIGLAQGNDLCLDAAYGVANVATLTETYVVALIDAMHTLTATAELRSADWETMKPLIDRFEQSSLLTYNAWFLMPDGTYYKVATGLASANLSDRSYFDPVMSGETTMGDLVISRSTGRKSMILTAPIELDQAIVGALGVTLYLEEFSELLHAKLQLPRGVGFYASNAEGLIAAHSDTSLLMETQSACGITLARGGLQVSDILDWTFVLGVLAAGP